MKAELRKKWSTVLIIALCWVTFISISFIDEYFFIYDLIALKTLSGSFPFLGEFIGRIVLGILVSLAGGYLLVFKLGTRYRNKSFAYGIINAGLIFILTYVFLTVFGLFALNLIYFSFQGSLSDAFTTSVNNVRFNIL